MQTVKAMKLTFLVCLETASYEENRVDQQTMDDQVQQKILSDREDKKILSKNKKAEEENLARLEKIALSAKAEQATRRPKRKRSTRAQQSKPTSVNNAKLPPGFKDIPEKLMKHFPKDHVLLCTEPNGLCGVSCGSAHIFAQPKEGGKFRKEINKYMVSHWEFFKDKIHFPYERQVEAQGESVKFENPWAFQNSLQTPAADWLWTDSEEIQTMCNKYQMSAVVVKAAHSKDDSPVVARVGPDPDILKLGLPNTTLIGPDQVPTMYLLLQGAHYDLAVLRETIAEKYMTSQEGTDHDGGYDAEEEDDNVEVCKTSEEKLVEMTQKYNRLKGQHIKILEELKDLKLKLNNSKSELEDDTDRYYEVNKLVESKS